MFKKYLFFIVVPFLYLADQISKQMIVRVLAENQSRPVIDGVFHLTRVNNTGAAFGLFRGATTLLILVTLVSIAVLSVALNKNWERTHPIQCWGWVLVIGGALGNLHDRLLYRYVIDFLDFRVWPVFNLADSFVCIGTTLVAITVFKKS